MGLVDFSTQKHIEVAPVEPRGVTAANNGGVDEPMEVEEVNEAVTLPRTDHGEATEKMQVDQDAEGDDEHGRGGNKHFHHSSLSPDATEDEYQPSSAQIEPSEEYIEDREEVDIQYLERDLDAEHESQSPRGFNSQGYSKDEDIHNCREEVKGDDNEDEGETYRDWTPDSRYETQVPRGPDYEDYRKEKEEKRRRREAGEGVEDEVEPYDNWSPNSRYGSQYPKGSDYPESYWEGDYMGQEDLPVDEMYDGGAACRSQDQVWDEDNVGRAGSPEFAQDQLIDEVVRLIPSII